MRFFDKKKEADLPKFDKDPPKFKGSFNPQNLTDEEIYPKEEEDKKRCCIIL